MADTAVAITAIIVSGVVGPGLSAWWTRRRQREDHEREARAELRAVLDEGANVIGNAKRCFERVYNLHREGVDSQSAEATEVSARWRAAMQEVFYLEDRIAIRLGDEHPVYAAFAAWTDTLEAQRNFARAYERKWPISTKLMDGQHHSHEAFSPARQVYVDAARRVVGPRLQGAASTAREPKR